MEEGEDMRKMHKDGAAVCSAIFEIRSMTE